MRKTENTKKRNARSAVVVGLLLLLVAAIGFGGYTLAKYVSSKSEPGSASVAKWGFTVEADASKLFGEKYAAGAVTTSDDSLTVNAANNAVAPGTSGSMTFKIEGSAEVKAEIKLDFNVTNDVKLVYTENGGAEQTYAPVKWTLTKTGETNPLVENATLANVKTELDKVATTVYAAGATAVDNEYTLSWAWDFESNNDALDTLLGMVANNSTANGEYTAVTGANKTSTAIGFTLNISVTQLAD